MPSASSPTRLWSYAAWIFGTLLALSILLALGATVWRMEQTYNIVDSDIAGAEDYRAMIDTSLHWSRVGLFIGIPAALLYVASLVQLYRGRNQDEWD